MRAIRLNELTKTDQAYVLASVEAGCFQFSITDGYNLVAASANRRRDIVVQPGHTLFYAVETAEDQLALLEVIPDAD